MKNIFFILSVLSFFLSYLAFIPKIAHAGTCNFTFNPSSVTQDSGNIDASFTTPDVPDGPYRFHYRGPGGAPTYVSPETSLITITGGKGSFSIPKLSSSWKAGRHEIYLIPQGRSVSDYAREASCNGSFVVADTAINSSTANCNTSIKEKSINPTTNVTLFISGPTPEGSFDLKVDGNSKKTYQISDGNEVSLGTYAPGDHKVEIRESCGIAGISCTIGGAPRLICSATAFRVVPNGQTGGGEIKLSDAQILQTRFCQDHRDLCSNAGGIKCPEGTAGISTGIGCVPTEPKALVEGLLRYGTLSAGGIAFLLMILAALQMITAEGNPNTIKSAQERFYSAIIGLLLIIFSVLLMQVIGVDLLGLKDFGR